MDPERVAAGAGAVAAAAVVLLVAAPYLVADPAAIAVYYAVGPGGPLLVGLFALVAAVVLAAGAYRRSDPATMAGAAVVLGGFVTALAWWWALSVDLALVGGLSDVALLEHHRWALAVAATVLLAAAAGYARAVL